MGISYIRAFVCTIFFLSSFAILQATTTPTDVGKQSNDLSHYYPIYSVDDCENDLQSMLQAIMDAQTLTNVMNMNFGGVSASLITENGETYDVFTGDATADFAMDASFMLGLSDASQTVLSAITLLLQEAEVLSLDQPISNFIDVSTLTNVPGDITIEQLLRHTSGLDNFADDETYRSTLLSTPERIFTPEELTELFVGEPQAPGTFNYSNTNFLVLGLVLESANGVLTLEQSLDLFLELADLEGFAFYPGSGMDPVGLASLFVQPEGSSVESLSNHAAALTGASFPGNIIAQPSKVARVMNAIQGFVDAGIISEENSRLLNDFRPVEGRLSQAYGLGLEQFNLEIDGVILPFVGHTGSLNYKTTLLYSEDADIGVFVSTNNSLANEADVLELARQLMDAAIDGTQYAPENFTLQFLHASDLEGGVEALDNAPNFAAIMEALEAENDNTIILSSGDNYIPGPFFNAAGSSDLRGVIQETYQEFFNEPGLTNLRETAGRIDISIMNFIGFDASAIGNHEFDAGPDAFAEIIGTDIRGDGLGDVRWLGAQFPYLSSNYDFSTEGALAGLATTDLLLSNTAFQSLPSDLTAAAAAPKIAPSTVIERGGELIGVIGATTQVLETISSSGNITGLTPTENDMVALAGIIQPIIDAMEEEGINKIAIVSHLQQEALEQELAGLLSGVDIIFAGGSDVLRAQEDDILRPGDEAEGIYPFTTTNADGEPVAIVGSPGEYSYVGRLIVEFDENGVLIEESLSNTDNGMYASIEEVVADVAGEDPFALGTNAELVQRLTNAIGELVNQQDGNILGRTNVFLEGRREQVRTQETNLGNLTADANLVLAQSFDETVEVSLKNGGGIRAAIGQIVEVAPGVYETAPPQGNPSVGKEVGDISQLDVVNSLRFNNGLSLLTLNMEEFKAVLEHAFAETSPGNTPGRFPQVGGFSVTVDTSMEEGNQVTDVFLIDEDGNPTEQLIDGGEIIAEEGRTIRIVTLDFLAGGGDGYPYDAFSQANPTRVNRVDLGDVLFDDGQATFADPGSEQDALAEFLISNTLETPYAEAETPAEEDQRIIFAGEAEPFTLQFLHASDLEGGVEALDNAPNFAAIMEALEAENDNTIILSSGDNYIPGPFFNAAGSSDLRGVIQETYQEFFNEPGLTNLRETAGRIDISIMNFIGFDASAIGNHEFDAGPDAFAEIIGTDIRGDGLGDVRWLGAQFPYLSSNYDFSTEGALAGLATTDLLLSNTAFQSLPSDLTAAAAAPKIAPSTVIERGGELIGVIGATTQVLETISSSGNITGLTPTENDMVALAGIIQPIIDAMEEEGINKIAIVSHLQQEALEQELAGLLSGVDIIFAGGSDVLRAQEDDILRPGDEAEGIYPFTTTNADGEPVAIVGSPGEYSYVGRLIVEFDENGVLIEESLSNTDNGMYASIEEVVADVAGEDPFALGTNAELVQRLTNAIGELVNQQDGNILGRTNVFLEGRREQVRTQETNLGNLTADANLVLAQSFDETVEVSLKNGGGIRAAIGQIVEVAPGVYETAPPQGNPSVGKEVGDISQLDVVNSLRFNNGLSLLTLNMEEFKAVLEHAFAETSPGNTPGRFPQVGGFSVTVDTSMEEGNQVTDVFLIDEDGNPTEQLIDGGEIIAEEGRTIRIVTLDFLAGGGDGYPYDAFSQANPTRVNRVDLGDVLFDDGQATFADPGSEQDALAEFLIANTLETPYAEAETSAEEDMRIIFSTAEPTNQAPNAVFTADPTMGDVPLEVIFDASGSIDSDGMIVSYDWDFGDGTTGSGITTTHIYDEPGTYTVTLTVTDDDGATATATQTIEVEIGETGTARVQIIHNADSETVRVLVNGEEFLPELAYRTATPYVDVPAGTPLEISLVPVNPFSRFPDPVTTTVTFAADETYVVMAYGTFDDADDFPVEVGLFEGAVENVGDQEVAIQFFHGSNDAGDVDITLEDGSVLFDDVTYGGFGASYLVVPADRYTINVTPATDNSNIVATYSAGFSFWKRRSAVIFASELLGDGTFQPWVALSNGGTYPLTRLTEFGRPEVLAQNISGWNESFKALPNPAYDLTRVSFELPEASSRTILSVHGVGGKVLNVYDYGQLVKGEHIFDIDLSNFAAGTYYLQLRSDRNAQTLPLIITK